MPDARPEIRFLIIRDHKENKQKCTLSPLEGRRGFEFLNLRQPRSGSAHIHEIPGGVLLTTDAPVLSRRDHAHLERGVVTIIDSTWARVASVLRRVRTARGQRSVRRSLPPEIVTAYPRVSKLYDDPQRGLASIEAVFAALVVLGAADLSVLDGYRWSQQFLRQNDLTWQRWGWDPHSRPGTSSLSV